LVTNHQQFHQQAALRPPAHRLACRAWATDTDGVFVRHNWQCVNKTPWPLLGHQLTSACPVQILGLSNPSTVRTPAARSLIGLPSLACRGMLSAIPDLRANRTPWPVLGRQLISAGLGRSPCLSKPHQQAARRQPAGRLACRASLTDGVILSPHLYVFNETTWPMLERQLVSAGQANRLYQSSNARVLLPVAIRHAAGVAGG
jgi:hypothetical protein